MEDQQLMEYFKFDAGDLQANRNGYFSEKQKKELYSRQTGAIREKRIAVMIAFPLSIILLSLMVFLYVKEPQWTQENSGAVVWLGICGGPMLLASLYIFRLSFIRQEYLLKKVEGQVNIIKENRRVDDHHYTVYELHIGGKTFRASSALGDVMMQGDTYAVYYSEGSVSGLDEIRSAELISKAKS